MDTQFPIRSIVRDKFTYILVEDVVSYLLSIAKECPDSGTKKVLETIAENYIKVAKQNY